MWDERNFFLIKAREIDRYIERKDEEENYKLPGEEGLEISLKTTLRLCLCIVDLLA